MIFKCILLLIILNNLKVFIGSKYLFIFKRFTDILIYLSPPHAIHHLTFLGAMHFRVKYDHFLSFAAGQYLHQIAVALVLFCFLGMITE